ncbi:MAG: hypothetical protein RL068_77 [Actinomycetota bacterium]
MKILKWFWPLLGPVAYAIWLLWLDSQGLLPNPMATHWGISGRADGFTDAEGHLPWALFALFLASGFLSAVLGYKKIHQTMRRLFVLIMSLFALFIYGLMIHVVWIQIGLTDAVEVVLSPWIFALGLPFLIMVLPVVLAHPVVVIGKDLRVTLRSIPFLVLRFDEIESVEKDFVRPTEYGGWGIRFARGKVAFVPSKGEALRLQTKVGEVILVRSNQVENLIAAIKAKI